MAQTKLTTYPVATIAKLLDLTPRRGVKTDKKKPTKAAARRWAAICPIIHPLVSAQIACTLVSHNVLYTI